MMLARLESEVGVVGKRGWRGWLGSFSRLESEDREKL